VRSRIFNLARSAARRVHQHPPTTRDTRFTAKNCDRWIAVRAVAGSILIVATAFHRLRAFMYVINVGLEIIYLRTDC
jgi:hypothetical protein